MVLAHFRGWDNVPKETKILSEAEALEHQRKLIMTWEKSSEVFFLKYGSAIAGLVAFAASFPLIHHFRKQFKLGEFGLLATYGPSTFTPSFLSYIGYERLVTSEIILMKMRCPLCTQFRYVAYHFCSAFIYTTAITAVTCSSVAFARKTRYVPPPHVDGKQFFKILWGIMKAGARTYQISAACQLIVILGLPYLQGKEFNNFMILATEKEMNRFNE